MTSKRQKLNLYLDLEWTFERLAHERSFQVFERAHHPVRDISIEFLTSHLKSSYNALDLGCNKGDLTIKLAPSVSSITGIDYNAGLIEDAKKNTGIGGKHEIDE